MGGYSITNVHIGVVNSNKHYLGLNVVLTLSVTGVEINHEGASLIPLNWILSLLISTLLGNIYISNKQTLATVNMRACLALVYAPYGIIPGDLNTLHLRLSHHFRNCWTENHCH